MAAEVLIAWFMSYNLHLNEMNIHNTYKTTPESQQSLPETHYILAFCLRN